MIPEDLRDNPLAVAFEGFAVAAKFEFTELTIEVRRKTFSRLWDARNIV